MNDRIFVTLSSSEKENERVNIYKLAVEHNFTIIEHDINFDLLYIWLLFK